MAENKYTTAGGKDISVVLIPKSILYKIQFSTGGELPAELEGRFTTPVQAEKEILKYLANQTKSKKPLNG